MADETENHQPDIRSLREAADAGRQAQAEAERLRRENMFLRVGVDLDSRAGKLLFKAWEGDSEDDLKAEALELGAIRGATATPPPSGPDNTDVAGQQDFRRTLSQGVAPAAAEIPSEDPREVAIRQYHEDRRNGVTGEKAQLAAFDRIWTAAVGGDERVIFTPDNWADNFRP